jgi:hypothetical protein
MKGEKGFRKCPELEESHGKPQSYALIGVIAANANEHIFDRVY